MNHPLVNAVSVQGAVEIVDRGARHHLGGTAVKEAAAHPDAAVEGCEQRLEIHAVDDDGIAHCAPRLALPRLNVGLLPAGMWRWWAPRFVALRPA